MKLIDDITIKEKKELFKEYRHYILNELFTGRLPIIRGVMIKFDNNEFKIEKCHDKRPMLERSIFYINYLCLNTKTQEKIIKEALDLTFNEYEPNLDNIDDIKNALNKAYCKIYISYTFDNQYTIERSRQNRRNDPQFIGGISPSPYTILSNSDVNPIMRGGENNNEV